jgi:hypothetical protein
MTGKDNPMKWDQIENKWAAMTRRIRADYASDRLGPTGGPERGLQCRDVISATIAGGRTAADKDAEPKITAK